MSRIARRQVMASSGNQPVYPSGNPLYGTPTHYGASAPLLVGIGQYVFFDPQTMTSLGNTITPTTNRFIGIGLGVQGPNGPELRKVVGDTVSGCFAEAISAEPSRCGILEQKDLWIDCTECNKDYSIVVHVEDNETEGFADTNRGYDYTFTYRTQCGGCDSDCPEPHDQNELICGLHNVIKGKFQPGWDISVNGKPWDQSPLPFDVHKLFFGDTVDGNGNPTDVTHYEFCLTPTFDTTLQEYVVEDIASFFFNGVQNDFTNTTATGDGSAIVTPVSRLDSLVEQANADFGGSGQATYIQGVGGPECAITLIVDTCHTDFEARDDADAPLTPCASGNPFDGGVTVEDNCDDCSSVDTTLRPSIGLRFFMKPISTDCECFAGNNTKAWLGSTMEVFPVTGFEEGGYHVIDVQAAGLPEGMGYVWEERELRYLRQGGVKYVINNKTGKLDLPATGPSPLQGGQATASKHGVITTDCQGQYCVISLVHTKRQRSPNPFSGRIAPKWETYFLIPSGDTTTQTEFLAIFNNYFAGGVCGLASISCSQDDDQQASFADYNGYIE